MTLGELAKDASVRIDNVVYRVGDEIMSNIIELFHPNDPISDTWEYAATEVSLVDGEWVLS